VIVARKETLEWPTDGAHVDVSRLRALVSERTPESLTNGEALFRGVLLEGVITGETAFEEWLDGERRETLRLFEGLVEGLVEFAHDLVDAKVAIAAAERFVAIDPLNEQAQRLLISAYITGGRRAEAARQYKSCIDLLRAELGVGPEAATKALYDSCISEPPHGRRVQTREKSVTEIVFSPEVVASPSLSEWPSIAVLPFSMPSADVDDAYLGWGLADEVIELLYRYRWLRVIARGSSFIYPSATSDPQKVADAFNVRFVVCGSVWRWNGRVRCMAQVMDATTGEYVWANHFDRKFDDVFLLVDELARDLVAELEPALARIERNRAMQAPPNDLSAWSCYHRGLAHFYRFRREEHPKAIGLLSRACLLQPTFATAHAYLSIAQLWSVMHGFALAPERIIGEARDAAEQAVDIDAESALSRYARSRINLRANKFDDALLDIEHAISVSPSFSGGHFSLAMYYKRIGRFSDVHSAIESTMRLSPQDPEQCYYYATRARAYLAERRHDEARDWARRGLMVANTNPLPLLSTLVSALGHLGANEDAAEALNELKQITRRPRTIGLYRNLMASTTNERFLEHFLDGLQRAGMPQ